MQPQAVFFIISNKLMFADDYDTLKDIHLLHLDKLPDHAKWT
jgi:hypothetical protein